MNQTKKLIIILVTTFIIGILAASSVSQVRASAQTSTEAQKDTHGHDEESSTDSDIGDDGHGHGSGGHSEEEGFIKLSAAQISAAEIETAPVTSGMLVKAVAAPGRIAVNADAQAKIVPKLSGTAARVLKQLGDPVEKGELLAVIESREMADAAAEYLASWRAEELARSTYEREERLWNQQVTAEQDYLTAKNAHQAAKIKLDLARQKLHAIGLSDRDVATLSKLVNESQFRFYEIRSPIAGHVTVRDVVLGQVVSTDKDIFTIADLSTVWVEMAVPPSDLPYAKEGQEVRIQAGTKNGVAKIVAISPVIDPETRSAKAIAELDNAASEWRIGDYVDSLLIAGTQAVDLMVPRGAVQSIGGSAVVFANEGGGFKARLITTGREDTLNVEILSGLEFGETIATSNTFTLKAELGKAEAEHEH